MIVYFYRNPDNLTEEGLNELITTLPEQQQQIVANIKNHHHRCDQVVAYTMLCHALEYNRSEINKKGIFLKEFSNLRFPFSISPTWVFGEHGKPYLTDQKDIYFNISHCNEAVAVAVSNREVGIDIEGRRKFSDTLLQRAFNKEEQALIRSADNPEIEFARIWTTKEAWFKYTGTGILMDHLKSTEEDARSAGCTVTTHWVNDSFWLSVAESSACAE